MLDDGVAQLLGKGGKFVPTPTNATPETITKSVDEFTRNVRLRFKFAGENPRNFIPQFHVRNEHYTPPMVDSPDNRVENWLKTVRSRVCGSYSPSLARGAMQNLRFRERSALRALAKRRDLVIKPADKNLGITLMSASWYKSECLRQLADDHVYRRVENHRLDILVRDTREFAVRVFGPEPKCQEGKFLLNWPDTHAECYPHFYVIPKLHKTPVVGRPIVPAHSYVTTGMSIYLAKFMEDIIMPKLQEFILSDMYSLLPDLDNMSFADSDEVYLVTGDVSSLYTNVDVKAALEAFEYYLEGEGPNQYFRTVSKFAIRAMLKRVLENNFFKFLDGIYHQIDGIAMGTPLAPPLANLYMAFLETRLQRMLAQQMIPWPRLYKRYIDDIFMVWIGSRQTLDTLLSKLNDMAPRIRINWNVSTAEVEFLDLVIMRKKSGLSYRTHQKVLNNYGYIPKWSFHPRPVFNAWTASELNRYAKSCRDEADFLEMNMKFWTRLRARGYSTYFLRPIFEAANHTDRFRVISPREHENLVVLKIPYGPATSVTPFQKVLHALWEEAPIEVRSLIDRVLVCFTRAPNLYQKLVRAEFEEVDG